MSDNDRFLKFSKPFIEATQNVFQTMMNTKIVVQKPQLKKEKNARGDLSSIMGINGKIVVDGVEKDFSGLIVMSYPKETYIKVASAILMEKFTEINDDNADAGAEINNMVTGNAKRFLAALGYKIEMSIPSTVLGIGHEIKYPSKTTVIIFPVTSDLGTFFIELCYQDSNSSIL